MMGNTTFREICKIMKNPQDDIAKGIKSVFEVGLLFLPGILCRDVSFIANAVNGATLLGAKPIIEESIKNILEVFNKKQYTEFTTKYEHAQIAQVLIVFSAYFDSIKLYLPNEEFEIIFSPKQKIKTTEECIADYIKNLEKNILKPAEQIAKDIFDFDLSIPDPIKKQKDYLEQLKSFYEILNKEFLQFYEKLSFLENMKEEKREYFYAIIRGLPNKAVENYKKQYYQLAINFNDFFVWTNIEEHRKLNNKLDIGFANIENLVKDYYEKASESKAKSTLENYIKKYQSYIRKPVIDTSEMDFCSSGEIVFPNKDQIFVPQSFKALTYVENMHLENQDTWKDIDEKEEIGKFIGDVLRHSKMGFLPLLILGHPGAGKSLLCSMLAARILYREYHVIIVKLRDTIADHTVCQQINEQIERDFANGCLWSDIAGSSLKKPILIIFDGYDELLQASGKTYSDYLQRIVDFQKEQKALYRIFVKCIVTSRMTLIDKAMITNDSPVMLLSDFDKERVNQWCLIWNEQNKKYFQQEKLDEFEVCGSQNILALSKQPLLLLMLALYDSNNNALKRNIDLNETQLYDNLIREFISREKRKSDSFRGKQVKAQENIIDQEMKKISIAALGMYNRKKLYIRSQELEKDLQFILSENNNTNDSSLSEGDKLLGSFFFIHKSNSTDMGDRGKISNAAYEFLHNTFGEFLTANYIVHELQNVLVWVNTIIQTNRQSQWRLSDQRAWVICMAYAPLFSRPVVLKMIHEWAKECLGDEIDENLSSLIDLDIEKVVNGDLIFDLKEVMDEKNNPFRREELLKHLAIYSLNLIIIRTVIFNNCYVFDFDEQTWGKLSCIWKYAFSEDELLSFTKQFGTTRVERGYKISYKGGEEKIYFNRMAEYAQITATFGNDIEKGIFGALMGHAPVEKMIQTIEDNQLNIGTRYLWNYSLNLLYSPQKMDPAVMDILFRINVVGWKEKDIQYICCSYILIEDLLKNKMVKIDAYSNQNQEVVRAILRVLENQEYLNYISNQSLIKICIYDTAINLLEYVEIDEIIIRDMIQSIRWIDYEYNEPTLHFCVVLFNKIMEKISRHAANKGQLELLYTRYLVEYLERSMYLIERQCHISVKMLTELLKIADNSVVLNCYAEDRRIEEVYYTLLTKVLDSHKERRFTFEQQILIVKTAYRLPIIRSKYQYDLLNICRKVGNTINLRKLYDSDKEAFYEWLVMLNDRGMFNAAHRIEDINWIVRHRGDQLSIKIYRQLLDFAEKMKCKELLENMHDICDR